MAKKPISNPGGNKRPSNRQRARGGTGPGPGYRPSSSGGGTSHKGPGGGTSGGNCCPMVAAIRSARRGQFRLAARYARWSARLIAARIA